MHKELTFINSVNPLQSNPITPLSASRSPHSIPIAQTVYSPDPHHIRLQDIHRSILDQLPASVPVVLMLSRRPRSRRHSILQQLVTGNIIRVQNLFPPLDVDLFVDTLLGELDGIVNVEGHVAVDHDGEIGSNVCSAFLKELDILSHTLVSLVRAVRKGNLAIRPKPTSTPALLPAESTQRLTFPPKNPILLASAGKGPVKYKGISGLVLPPIILKTGSFLILPNKSQMARSTTEMARIGSPRRP